MHVTARIRRIPLTAYDTLLVGTTVVLALGTVAMLTLPVPPLRVMAPAVDLTLDNVALLITSLVAVLAWVRFRERQQPFALFQASGFLVLAMANFTAVSITLTATADSTLTTVEPGDDQLLIFTGARLLCALLLVFGGLWAVRGHQVTRPMPAIVLPALLMAGGLLFVAIGHPLFNLITGHDADPARPELSPLGSALQLSIAALLGAAAILARHLWLRDGAVGDKYIAFGLILAGFAQVHSAVFPGTHPGPVSSADVLRLGFDVVLLLAIEAEARAVMSSLRSANRTMKELRAVEIDRAALDERARLARELHDGLAQALWLAKLKIVRLLSSERLTPAGRQLASETADAVELGLSEARQAVMAMHTSAATDSGFTTLLSRYLRDYADRFGIDVDFATDGEVPQLRARVQAELLRIAQEALTNVHRHAEATSVTVRVGGHDGEVELSIVDNGRGFTDAEIADSAFGLAAMRERATIIGGRLDVTSVLHHGTRVRVVTPAPAA
jgi:signal transduction histidine kinase